MIIQEKHDFDGDGGIEGEFWQDIKHDDPPDILVFLTSLKASIGIEYRIIRTEHGNLWVSYAIIVEPINPNYAEWRD